MTGTSVLLVTLLFVAPCASMKMKTTESVSDDGEGGGWRNRDPSKAPLPFPECDVDVQYTMTYSSGSKTCYIYHNYAGNAPDGTRWSLPEKYGFADSEFKLSGLSSKTLFKVNQLWPWYFTAEVADEDENGNQKDIDFDEGKSCNGQDSAGEIDICPHGPIWAATHMIDVKKNQVKEMREELVTARVDFEEALEHYKNVSGKEYDPADHTAYNGYGEGEYGEYDYYRKQKKTKEHKK